MRHPEPREAFELLQRTPQAVLIDCRSETELHFVGHPVGAIHIAWSDGPKWEVNPDFALQVGRASRHDAPVVLICRSGNRSPDAGRALEDAGFSDVCNILHGFEGELDAQQHRGTRSGWRFEGSPREQS